MNSTFEKKTLNKTGRRYAERNETQNGKIQLARQFDNNW